MNQDLANKIAELVPGLSPGLPEHTWMTLILDRLEELIEERNELAKDVAELRLEIKKLKQDAQFVWGES